MESEWKRKEKDKGEERSEASMTSDGVLRHALYTANDWERKAGTWVSTVHEEAIFLGNTAPRESDVFASPWTMRLSKADEITREFAIKKEKLIQGFIAKISSFVIGVLIALVTLFLIVKS